MHRLRKLSRLSFADQCLLIEAACFTAVARLTLVFLPFRWIAPWLGQHMAITPETQADGDRHLVYRIQRAIRIASNYVPWKSQCLAQAIAATIMLRLRSIEGTVYLGIAKKDNQQAVAHAWLRSGKTIVTGARGREEHSVVSTFAFGAAQTRS